MRPPASRRLPPKKKFPSESQECLKTETTYIYMYCIPASPGTALSLRESRESRCLHRISRIATLGGDAEEDKEKTRNRVEKEGGRGEKREKPETLFCVLPRSCSATRCWISTRDGHEEGTSSKNYRCHRVFSPGTGVADKGTRLKIIKNYHRRSDISK